MGAIAQMTTDGIEEAGAGRPARVKPQRKIAEWDAPGDGIALVGKTALRTPEKVISLVPATAELRSKEDRERATMEKEALSVGIAQPDRRGFGADHRGATVEGSAFARLWEPLGRFCATHALKDDCYRAGEAYDELLRQAKAAKGFIVPGLVAGENPIKLTQAQIDAMREAAILREKKITGILRAIMPRAPGVMERLCYDRMEPSVYDEGLIKHCLLALADEFGFLDLGINRGKGI